MHSIRNLCKVHLKSSHSKSCLSVLSQSGNSSEILHRARQSYCCALCKNSEGIINWSGHQGRRSIYDIGVRRWIFDEFLLLLWSLISVCLRSFLMKFQPMREEVTDVTSSLIGQDIAETGRKQVQMRYEQGSIIVNLNLRDFSPVYQQYNETDSHILSFAFFNSHNSIETFFSSP